MDDEFQCPVCMLLPDSGIYQCINGHLICETCKNAIQSSRNNAHEPAGIPCPTCRVLMPTTNTSRVLAMEESLSSRMETCMHCSKSMIRREYLQHVASCPESHVLCEGGKEDGGCCWSGKLKDLEAHASACPILIISLFGRQVEGFRGSCLCVHTLLSQSCSQENSRA